VSFAGLSWDTLALYAGLFGGAMVLLYLLRVRRRTVYVPFSPLWARVLDQQRASSLFRRLKRPGSLALQLLLVGLLVFALGDPRTDGDTTAGCRYQAPAGLATSSTLILVDTSASMRAVHAGRSRMESAIAEAQTTAREALAVRGRRVMVATFDVTATPLTSWTGDLARVERALNALREDARREVGTAPRVAAEFARDALRHEANSDAIIISDFAFSDDFAGLDFRPITVGEAGENLGLETFNVRPMPDDPLTYVGWYAARNDSPDAVKAVLYIYAAPAGRSEADFTTGTKLVHSEPLDLKAGETRAGQIPNLKFQGDRVMARIAFADAASALDIFPNDDVAFAVVPERRRLRVQLVTPGNAFLSAALSLRENLAVTTHTPAEYAGQDGFDITVLDGVPLKAGENSRVLQIAPPELDSGDALVEVETRVLLQKHPLLRGVNVVDWNISEMPAYATAKTDTIVIGGPSKAPVLWTRTDPDGTRRIILSFDLKKSLLPMNLAFPLLIVNALNVLANEADGVFFPIATDHTQGVPLPFKADRVLVDRPDTTREEAPVVGGAARFDLTKPGIYDIQDAALTAHLIDTLSDAPNAPHHAVAVNLMSPDESRLTPQPLVAAPKPGDVPTLDAASTQEPHPTPWWRWLMFAAIGLVLVEQLSWHRRWTV